jgi:hypothetical protein
MRSSSTDVAEGTIRVDGYGAITVVSASAYIEEAESYL